MNKPETTQPTVGDVREISSKLRMQFTETDGLGPQWELQDLADCRYCSAQEWLPASPDGQRRYNGWHAREVAEGQTLAFCPDHAQDGGNLTEDLRMKIGALVRQTVDGGRRAREAEEEALRPYGLPAGRNPSGLYSQGTAGWLASLPSSKPGDYWRAKRRMFPAMAEQQEKMNFPDLIEMRAWTILFRHSDLIWSIVMRLWEETADLLRTPYPFSDPRFLEDPDGTAGQMPAAHRCRVGNHRLGRLRESLLHREGLPVRWNITQDLGVDGEGITVLADPRVHSGQPYIEDTDLTLAQATMQDRRTTVQLTGRLDITIEQMEAAHMVDRLLRIPGWPFKKLDVHGSIGP